MELNTIHKAVCYYYKVDLPYIFKRDRNIEIVEKRLIYYYLAKNKSKKTLSEIGRYPGKISGNVWQHSTVYQGATRLEALIEFDKKLRKDVEEIEKLCEHFNIKDEKVSKYKDEIFDLLFLCNTIEDVNNKITEFVNNNK